MKPILVIGSLNMDFVVQTDKLPLPGETIKGRDLRMIPQAAREPTRPWRQPAADWAAAPGWWDESARTGFLAPP